MITIVEEKKTPPRVVAGNRLQAGKAYRLVRNHITEGFNEGEVYFAAADSAINMKTGTVRGKHSLDEYIEVDLEILVKEKN